jgi:hypothetical protein
MRCNKSPPENGRNNDVVLGVEINVPHLCDHVSWSTSEPALDDVDRCVRVDGAALKANVKTVRVRFVLP